jgi:hypothetical protein
VGSGGAENIESEWRRLTQQLLATLPRDYQSCRRTLAALSHAFRNELAEAFEGHLNTYIQTLPQQTYQERKVIASFVNEELRELGLAIKCPRSGRPAILIADVKNSTDGTGRFRLESRNDGGHKYRTRTSSKLFALNLIEDSPRKEGMARWTQCDR